MRTQHLAAHYIQTHYASECALLQRINAALGELGREWQVGADEGRLLQWLIRVHGARRIVEIGTLAGYSAIWMARALPEGGALITIERDEVHARMAQGFILESDVANRITLYHGAATTVLEVLRAEAPFDMVFIDADKPGYNDYLDWAEECVRPGGLIVADNTFLFDAVFADSPPEGVAPTTWAGMRRFNERLADRTRFDATMIPTAQGLSVAIKR